MLAHFTFDVQDETDIVGGNDGNYCEGDFWAGAPRNNHWGRQTDKFLSSSLNRFPRWNFQPGEKPLRIEWVGSGVGWGTWKAASIISILILMLSVRPGMQQYVEWIDCQISYMIAASGQNYQLCVFTRFILKLYNVDTCTPPQKFISHKRDFYVRVFAYTFISFLTIPFYDFYEFYHFWPYMISPFLGVGKNWLV